MYGIVPLFASPISEVPPTLLPFDVEANSVLQEFGRRPVYIFSTIMFTLAQVMAAL